MTFVATLGAVIAGLNSASIPHMLIGSFAAGYHGEPRQTNDIDLMIDPDEASLRAFLDGLERPRFYVDDALAALRHRDQFNVIDSATGWKVDMVVVKDQAFSRSEMARRRPVTIEGVALNIATAEDTILAKLEWAAMSGSDRQRRDVAGILVISGETLDWTYLHRWADELGLRPALDEAVRTAE